MSETVKHTPGPWVWRGKSGSLHRVGTPPYAYGELVLNPTWDYDAGVEVDISEADACLITAAPDMLAALQAMLGTYGPPLASIDYPTNHPITLSREAIAKATGGAS